ncbi:MAG: clostripain-related cysteine peptidase [Candidatus Thermoplasmatota archaeon]|nr:clostripain-related cysteine peptidase [Candidatus Thermoplasmatota archaeon]
MRKQILILAVLSLIIILFLPMPNYSQQHSTLKKWTIMIYLDADNNLEEAGIEDFNELEVIGSSNEVNVVVQIDRIDEYDDSNNDWKGAKRYYVTKDEDTAIINSVELEDLGEVNMGDPATLIDFVLWSIENYPAEHYLLDFWDHGGAWTGVCWDDTDKDYLTLPEIDYALREARKKINKNIDLVLFDACNMGSLEVFYQLRNYVDVAVGSEATVPGDGCPYDKILSFLVDTPAATPEELAAVIVDSYINSYTDGESDPDDVSWATMSAFKLEKFHLLAEQIDQLCMLLSKNAALPPQGYNLQIVDSRNRAETFYTPAPSPFLDIIPNLRTSIIDFYDFGAEINSPRHFRIDERAKLKAREAMKIFDELKLASKHAGAFPDSHGLTIYFPNDKTTQYKEDYGKLAFAEHKYWDEFIECVNYPQNAENIPPTCLILEPKNYEIITAQDYLIKGIAFDVESLRQIQIKIDDGEWQIVEGLEEWHYNWKATQGTHKIYAMSFDGTQYSVEFEIEVEVLESPRAATVPFWIIIAIVVVVLAILYAIIKTRRITKKL